MGQQTSCAPYRVHIHRAVEKAWYEVQVRMGSLLGWLGVGAVGWAVIGRVVGGSAAGRPTRFTYAEQ